MHIVVNVDNELYEYFSKRRTMHDNGYFSNIGKLIKALRNGTILPKGHGKLIDVKQIVTEDECIWNSDGSCTTITTYDIDSTSTIVEADREEREDVK